MVSITVMYSCSGCGLIKAKCEVPARTTEDVVVWTRDILGGAVGSDHHKRSPSCTSDTMSEVWIPITGSDKVGGPSLQ